MTFPSPTLSNVLALLVLVVVVVLLLIAQIPLREGGLIGVLALAVLLR